MPTPALELSDLRYRYPARDRRTLDGVTLTVRPGEFVLIAGPTGSGKSTLVRCLSGWIPAEQDGVLEGTVRVGGVDPGATPAAELCARLGIVLQSPEDQLFSPAVDDEIVFGLENLRRPRAEMARALEEVVALLGLGPHRHVPVPSLSGGTKQRVAIAAMLALGPGLLVLDEPLSQLDPPACRTVLERLAHLHRTRGLTIVLVEHRLAAAVPFCDRIVLLDEGRVVLDRPAAEAFADLAPYRRLGLRVPDAISLCADADLGDRPRTIDALPPLSLLAPRPSSSSPSPILLRAEHVAYHYTPAAPVLRNLSFGLPCGRVTALLGANGAGKSTLLRLLAGLAAPRTGRFVWEDGGAPPRPGSGRVGVVFQDPDLMLQARTVAEEVHWGPDQLGRRDEGQRALETRLLADLRLAGLEAEPPHALSRGQRQRVALAAVLSLAPELLCLDEPTTGQDLAGVESLLAALRAGERPPTVVVATQDVAFALAVADRVLVVHQGQAAAEGDPLEVLARSTELEAWGLLPPDAIRIAEHLGIPPVRRVEDWRSAHVAR